MTDFKVGDKVRYKDSYYIEQSRRASYEEVVS
jgi:hypothetical protein